MIDELKKQKNSIIEKLSKIKNVKLTNNLIDVGNFKLLPYTKITEDNTLNKRLYSLAIHQAWEIFCLEIYGINVTNKNNSVVMIDIGMNIGAASIYFSSKPFIKHVYSYEPIFDNYKHAVLNIALNGLENKITPNNFGLSGAYKELLIPFSKSDPQRASEIEQTWEDYTKRNKEAVMCNIILKPANEIIDEIISNNVGNKIWIKTDCQGSEYEILKSLNDSHFDKIEGILGEFHHEGVSNIVSLLASRGYNTHYKYDYNGRTGFFVGMKIK